MRRSEGREGEGEWEIYLDTGLLRLEGRYILKSSSMARVMGLHLLYALVFGVLWWMRESWSTLGSCLLDCPRGDYSLLTNVKLMR